MWSRKEWLILILSMVVFALFTRAGATLANDQSRIAAVESIVERGTFIIDDSGYTNSTIDKVFINGHFYSDKPALSYLIFVPLYAILNSFGITLSKHPHLSYFILTWLIIGLSVSIMLIYFYRLLKMYRLSENIRLLYTSMLGFGTLIFPYALVVNNHALAAAFLIFSYHAYTRAKNASGFILAGLLAGLAVTFDLVSGSVFLVVFATILIFRKSSCTKEYLIAAALPIFIFLLINFSISGSIIPFSIRADFFTYPGSAFYGGQGLSGLAEPTLNEMINFLFGMFLGHKGIFTLTPMLLFSLAGLIFSLKNKKYGKNASAIAAGLAIIIAYYVLKVNQYGGCAFGFRFFVAVIPLLFLFTPAFFEKKHGRAWYALFAILALFSLVVAVSGVFQNAWTCQPEIIIELLVGRNS